MNIPIHRCFDACVTEQLLQHLGLHSCLNRACRVGMPQSVHTEAVNPSFVAKFVKVGIIRTVLCRLSRPPVNENQVAHDKRRHCSCTPVHVLQRLRECFGLFLLISAIPYPLQDFKCKICQRNGAIALLRFRRTRSPVMLCVTILQGFVYRKCSLFKINRIPCQSDQFARA